MVYRLNQIELELACFQLIPCGLIKGLPLEFKKFDDYSPKRIHGKSEDQILNIIVAKHTSALQGHQYLLCQNISKFWRFWDSPLVYSELLIPNSFYSYLYIEYNKFLKSNYQIYFQRTNLATPFCKTIFPEWICPQGGKPLSCRNNKASRICLPNLCTCFWGRPWARCWYFSVQSSFQELC